MTLEEQQRPARGFTLVEVAMALAVASLAIMSIIGLMPMLLDSERENTATSAFPAMCSQVMGRLRTEPYPNTLPTASRLFYFTDQGTLVSQVEDAVFECEVRHKVLTPEGGRPGGALAPQPGAHCHMVQMRFRWPASSPGGSVRIFHATLAND